jgi:hypothetical protein
VSGDDLLGAGIPAGPMIGELLQELRQRVIAEPPLNDAETLLALARERYDARRRER